MRRRTFITLLGGGMAACGAGAATDSTKGQMSCIDMAGCCCASHHPLQGFQFD
jgi:hypothetical protein